MLAVRLAMAHRNSGSLFANAAAIAQASQALMPVIATGGIVPAYGSASIIQPGEWVSIYGVHLATGTSVWKGDFPSVPGRHQRADQW